MKPRCQQGLARSEESRGGCFLMSRCVWGLRALRGLWPRHPDLCCLRVASFSRVSWVLFLSVIRTVLLDLGPTLVQGTLSPCPDCACKDPVSK